MRRNGNLLAHKRFACPDWGLGGGEMLQGPAEEFASVLQLGLSWILVDALPFGIGMPQLGSGFFPELVSHVPHSFDEGVSGILDLAPESSDVHIHCPVATEVVIAPDLVE